MSRNDFFAGAWRGHKFPDSVYNSGPIPPKDTSGYPNGLGAQADARINYNSTLLGDLQPYAYGRPGRLSSQTAYLPIPHMLQKIVPPLHLPAAQAQQGDGKTKVYHAVDDGDLAFTIVLDRMREKTQTDNVDMDVFGMSSATYRGRMDPLCNLCTVNYLLAGFQLYSGMKPGGRRRLDDYVHWKMFLRHIGWIQEEGDIEREMDLEEVLKIVRTRFIPFGVPRGSDQQGGQSQGTQRFDQYPVDHVTSLLLDGKCQNLVNIWRKQRVQAGESMILKLEKIEPGEYVLSRQTHSYNKQDFRTSDADINKRIENKVWQLVPHILSMTLEEKEKTMKDIHGYDYRAQGYWHICMALQMAAADPAHKHDKFNDATKYRKTGELLEVSFEPVWVQNEYPGAESSASGGGGDGGGGAPPGDGAGSDDEGTVQGGGGNDAGNNNTHAMTVQGGLQIFKSAELFKDEDLQKYCTSALVSLTDLEASDPSRFVFTHKILVSQAKNNIKKLIDVKGNDFLQNDMTFFNVYLIVLLCFMQVQKLHSYYDLKLNAGEEIEKFLVKIPDIMMQKRTEKSFAEMYCITCLVAMISTRDVIKKVIATQADRQMEDFANSLDDFINQYHKRNNTNNLKPDRNTPAYQPLPVISDSMYNTTEATNKLSWIFRCMGSEWTDSSNNSLVYHYMYNTVAVEWWKATDKMPDHGLDIAQWQNSIFWFHDCTQFEAVAIYSYLESGFPGINSALGAPDEQPPAPPAKRAKTGGKKKLADSAAATLLQEGVSGVMQSVKAAMLISAEEAAAEK